MKDQVVFRPIKKSDYKDIDAMILQTWRFDEYCENKTTLKHFLRCYLLACMKEQTYTCIAQINGRCVGVIMGRCDRLYQSRKHFKEYLALMYHGAMMMLHRDGRKNKDVVELLEKANREMIENCQQPFDGEVVLFLCDEAYRGQGIGKALMRKLNQYFAQHHVASCFVYTDTLCSYEFYERDGFQRLDTRDVDIPIINNTLHTKFFLYAKTFSTTNKPH